MAMKWNYYLVKPSKIATALSNSWFIEFQQKNLDGNIIYEGQNYDSPSGAAKVVAVDWKSVNGWAFWQYYDAELGQWKFIGELRHVIYL